MPKIGVKYNNTYISGIKIGTDVSTLVNNIKKVIAYLLPFSIFIKYLIELINI